MIEFLVSGGIGLGERLRGGEEGLEGLRRGLGWCWRF